MDRMDRSIYRLPVAQIIDILKFLPDKTCAEIITGTELRQISKQLKSAEHLTLSRISQEKILPIGTLVYQGSRTDNVWNMSHNLGWYTTGTPSQLNYAGACPEERGYVHQFRTKRQVRVAVHQQMLNYILFTSDLVIEWDICKKYDGLFIDNGSQDDMDELAICNPVEYLEYTNSLRCADHQNFIVGGLKLTENRPPATPPTPTATNSSRNPSHRLRLVPKSASQLRQDDSVESIVSRAASTAVSKNSGGSVASSMAPSSVVSKFRADPKSSGKDPWGAFDGPAGGVLFFSIVLDQNATNEIGHWCLDKIAQEGNWRVREIWVTSDGDRAKFLEEANAIRKEKSANPNVPLPCDRFTLPVIFWDNYQNDTLINRKLVGGYTELIEFLGYINKVK